MPQFLEAKLKAEYPNNPGAVYGTMNKLGAMKGNKETTKGKAMQRKHDAKVQVHSGFQSVQSAVAANPPAPAAAPKPKKARSPFGAKQAPAFGS